MKVRIAFPWNKKERSWIVTGELYTRPNLSRDSIAGVACPWLGTTKGKPWAYGSTATGLRGNAETRKEAIEVVEGELVKHGIIYFDNGRGKWGIRKPPRRVRGLKDRGNENSGTSIN